ncbi:MAG: hypothetical protein IJ111_10430 [Eggerthellaceae bacterium]|nr:hypothetical protein [Eggerthellaceae bacterium]
MSVQADRASVNSATAPETGDGFSRAYRYRDPRSRMYEVTVDKLEAERLVGEDYETVLVHLTDGYIDRIVGGGSGDGKKEGDEISPPLPDGRLEGRAQRDTSNECPSGSKQRSGGRNSIRRVDRPKNGLGIAYRYVDPKTGACGWAPDETYARLAAEGVCEAIWVRYRDGRIARAATAEEYQEELEVRIGEQISEGLSEAQLNEFDMIDDQSEATRWLERNRPDYRDIVGRTIREMERAAVLDADVGGGTES